MRERGWVGASEILGGDQLLIDDCRWLTVGNVFDTKKSEPVYNLRISEGHTYFVGSVDWGFSIWVHNICAREVKALLADAKLNPKNIKLSPEESHQIARSLNANGQPTFAASILESKGYTPEQARVIAGELKVNANQIKHDMLVRNQQRELIAEIEAAPRKEKRIATGRALRKQGKRYEETTRSTLEQIPGASVRPAKLAEGEGGEIDHWVCKGGKEVFVESKYSLRKINDRMVNQITHSVRQMERQGVSVFLDVARKPTQKELAALEERLGNEVFSKIKNNIVSSQTELFKRVKSALD